MSMMITNDEMNHVYLNHCKNEKINIAYNQQFLFPLKLCIIWFMMLSLGFIFMITDDNSMLLLINVVAETSILYMLLPYSYIMYIVSLIGFVYAFCRNIKNIVKMTQATQLRIPLNSDRLDNDNYNYDDNINIDSDHKSVELKPKSTILLLFTKIFGVIMGYSDYFVIVNAIITCIGTIYQLVRIIPQMDNLTKETKISNKYLHYQSLPTKQKFNILQTEGIFCIAAFGIASLVILVSVYSNLRCHLNNKCIAARVKSKCFAIIYNIFSNDKDNRAIITIKFGLLCVKPFLILLTNDEVQAIVYYILQFCSITIISYLTYTKIHYNDVYTNENNVKIDQTKKIGVKSSIYTFSNIKLFGKHYLLSYIITNFSSYFILIILVLFKPQDSNGYIINEWIPLIYGQYTWLYFAKMYHNEIVRYFKDKNNSSMVDQRIDYIVFWLKMVVFSSFICLIFVIVWISEIDNQDQDLIYFPILMIQMLMCFIAFANSIWSLRSFKVNI